MKERLDQELAARNLARSRSHARQLITEGHVTLNGKGIRKPSHPCREEDEIVVTGGYPYVSRGGVKLERALKAFGMDVKGMTAIDVGASTGGFTHCLLQAGIAKVYAVDVGREQLAPCIGQDERVVSLEQTDIRELTLQQVGGGVPLIVCDLSFISLTMVFPPMDRLLLPKGQAVCLIKPQFEAGRQSVGKGGLVKSQKAHRMVLETLYHAAAAHDLYLTQCLPSPIRGGDGNIEYLALLERETAPCPRFSELVTSAFEGGETS